MRLDVVVVAALLEEREKLADVLLLGSTESVVPGPDVMLEAVDSKPVVPVALKGTEAVVPMPDVRLDAVDSNPVFSVAKPLRVAVSAREVENVEEGFGKVTSGVIVKSGELDDVLLELMIGVKLEELDNGVSEDIIDVRVEESVESASELMENVKLDELSDMIAEIMVGAEPKELVVPELRELEDAISEVLVGTMPEVLTIIPAVKLIAVSSEGLDIDKLTDPCIGKSEEVAAITVGDMVVVSNEDIRAGADVDVDILTVDEVNRLVLVRVRLDKGVIKA